MQKGEMNVTFQGLFLHLFIILTSPSQIQSNNYKETIKKDGLIVICLFKQSPLLPKIPIRDNSKILNQRDKLWVEVTRQHDIKEKLLYQNKQESSTTLCTLHIHLSRIQTNSCLGSSCSELSQGHHKRKINYAYVM